MKLNDGSLGFSYVRFDKQRCTGCGFCLKACPTTAIRIRNGRSVRIEGQCIGCGECMRVCPEGAVNALTDGPSCLEHDNTSMALVSPVLYSQFPGVMPKDVLLGLRQIGFHHTVDMSYFAEMFQFATEEFITRNRARQKAPWPLISPVCPVVVRLIALRFPSLLSHILPVIRPVAIMAREVRNRINQDYGDNTEAVAVYYINPCPTRARSQKPAAHAKPPVERAMGINDVYPLLSRQVDRIMEDDQISIFQHRFEYETCITGNGPLWGMSGGEITEMNNDRTLAVSGLNEVITYLEKIEMGLFSDLEYMEFRTCPEGCLGGVLTAIDRYLAKSAAQQMIKRIGLGKRLSPEHLIRLYDKGWFHPKKSPDELVRLFGTKQEPLSIESLQKVEALVNIIKGKDCGACGAPNCRTFAEDVVRGRASLDACIVVHSRGAI